MRFTSNTEAFLKFAAANLFFAFAYAKNKKIIFTSSGSSDFLKMKHLG